MIFILQFVIVVDHTDLWLLNHPSFHSWDKSNLIMVYDLLNLLLNSFCSYFIEDFCILVHQWYWPIIFFLRGVFVWFCYQCSAGLIEWVQQHSFLFNFLEYFEKHRYWLLKCIVEFCDAIWSYTFVCWQFFLILTQFQCWSLICSYFLSSWYSLRKIMFLGIYIFPLDCPFYWHKICHSNLLWMILCISVAWVVTSLSFLILFIWALSLIFLMSLAKGFSCFLR